MNNDTIYDEACIYKLYLDGAEKVYIGQHKNLLVQERLYGHRSGAKRDEKCHSKYLFHLASNPKDVKIEIVCVFQNITFGELKDKEREQIILHGYYDGGVWNDQLPSSLPTAELSKKRQAEKRKDPAFRKQQNEDKKEWRKTDKGKAEYARKQAKRVLKAEQKRLVDFQAIPDDDMNWLATISKHALTIYPRTPEETANNRRRIKKKWAVKNRELCNIRRRKPK